MLTLFFFCFFFKLTYIRHCSHLCLVLLFWLSCCLFNTYPNATNKANSEALTVLVTKPMTQDLASHWPRNPQHVTSTYTWTTQSANFYSSSLITQLYLTKVTISSLFPFHYKSTVPVSFKNGQWLIQKHGELLYKMVRNNYLLSFLHLWYVWVEGLRCVNFPLVMREMRLFFLPLVLYIAVNILSQDILHPPLCTCQNLECGVPTATQPERSWWVM